MPPISDDHVDSETGIRYTKLRSWIQDNHEVAWMRFEGKDIYDRDFSREDLFCECDFEKPRVFKDCEPKSKVRALLMQEARGRHGDLWKKLGPKEAILDIFTRVKSNEYLGQHYHGMIYYQEAADLLETPPAKILKHCEELFAEEKLDMYGAILTEYKRRFRFPQEIQNLFAYMIEEPLGWPNGDAGDIFIRTLEDAINDHTDYKHGKDAFYPENYPHISSHLLLLFGKGWITLALQRAKENPADRKDVIESVNLENIVQNLEKIARELRRLK